jgi:NAD(P) transhydrogenase
MRAPEAFDLISLGSGPAGQKAAIQAAKSGFRAAVIEREAQVGGACLLSGTIPSKALRELALRYRRMRGNASSLAVTLNGEAPLSALLGGVDRVIAAQDRYLRAQLERNDVAVLRGHAGLADAHRIELTKLDGTRSIVHAARIVIATGSRPRHVAGVEVDHEHILDSDSILSLCYLPRSLIVLGSGVIACEYASIFAALGCDVTLVDRAPEPLGFLDAALRGGFCAGFESMGGSYRGGAQVETAQFDGFSQVEVRLQGGTVLRADIVLAAFGRVANVDGMGFENLGLAMTTRGHVRVDARLATNIPGIFAAGDAIGPPALASAAADQGRRAAQGALGLTASSAGHPVPTGVYTIPEIACAGLTESDAALGKLEVIVGRADFSEVARAHICGEPQGFLALLCDAESARVLGVQAVGEGATDLVHLGQAAIAAGASALQFVDQLFNFPTMTEAYRIAAFDVLKQQATRRAAGAARLPRVALPGLTDFESGYRRTHCT